MNINFLKQAGGVLRGAEVHTRYMGGGCGGCGGWMRGLAMVEVRSGGTGIAALLGSITADAKISTQRNGNPTGAQSFCS